MISVITTTDNLNKFLYKAIGFHLAIVLLAIMMNLFMNMNFFDFQKNKKKIEIVQASVRVDLVELPKMTLKELKKINLNTEAVKEPLEKASKTNETSKIEFKKKAKKVDLSNLLKNFSSKKIKKIKVKKKKSILAKEAIRKLILEGNKISKGASTTGQLAAKGQAEYLDYIQRLPDRIRPFWKLPSYLMDKDLNCRIRVYIGSNGQILRTEIFETSGETEFDKKAIAAVKKSGPFPKPGTTIISRVTSGEVILGFPL